MDFDKLRTLPGTTPEEFDRIRAGILALERAQNQKNTPTCQVEQMQLPLADKPIAVLCFFNCPYVAWSVNPQAAHELMERHYREKHSRQIEQIVTGGKKGKA